MEDVFTVTVTPASGGTILLVVPDAGSLTPQDSVKKAWMESWSFTVVPISANDTQGNFDAAVATSDAAYISEEITSGDLNTKLVSATIGIVTEETALLDEFGFSSGKLDFTDTAIDITDNTHYITSPFSVGSLTVTSSSQTFHYLDGTIAAGAFVLAEELATANSTLVVLDVGAALDPSGTAAGRRVNLPWGNDPWDINSLTVDGKTLMLRAIEWATGLGADSNWAPTVASAIPDTTVTENASPIDNYRDLKAVFTDVEDGSGLTYSIESNTNSGLVTPTIVVADSTLDLSFTASTTGTATITIRATDSGSSYVEDVFTVTVDPGSTPGTFQEDDVPGSVNETDDAKLMAASPAINYAVDRLEIDDGGSLHEHSVLKFPNIFGGGVGAIPLGSSIISATLTLEVSNGGDDVLLYQLIESWDEATVTWDDASTGVSWTYAGADSSHIGTAVGTLSAPSGSNSVDVTASVQNWSFGALNEGWLLKDTGTDGVDIRQSEYGTASVRPKLEVTWVPNTAPTVASAIPDTTVNQDNAPIDNYRDLKAVFTDANEGSALTYSIESNTNSGLVTPTIVVADSTLDLSFTASTSGTATITMRATDAGGLFVDDVFTVTVNGLPTVAGAIADTTVYENNAAIDNYRDLKAVFTDAEDGSGLTYSIESNTNSGLVTATIVPADSTLDLSFTASTHGTATITVRATDSGSLFVDEVFTVAVNETATLVGRYWLNEATSGQVPDTVFDDQPSPVNLGITYDASLNWTLDNGHRGLGGSVAEHGGIASAPVAGTKYETSLDRATQATMVVVMEWGSGNGDRMAGFQRSDGTRTLQVLTKSGGDLELRFDGIVESPRIYWPGTWDDGVRRVFHIVYDTYDPVEDDRVRLYVDGVDQGTPSFTSGAMPPLGDSLDFSDPTNVLALLNEPDLTNGLPGTVFYYGVYTGEMTDAEITADYTALSADDDNLNPPTVASAIADTTVTENASPIDNYRDLKAVFTDVEDGSALTYSIESNTNSGLVTPTIVAADSTLDLSFTASTSGTATITIRATDSDALFVEDVFTVTVNAFAGNKQTGFAWSDDVATFTSNGDDVSLAALTGTTYVLGVQVAMTAGTASAAWVLQVREDGAGSWLDVFALGAGDSQVWYTDATHTFSKVNADPVATGDFGNGTAPSGFTAVAGEFGDDDNGTTYGAAGTDIYTELQYTVRATGAAAGHTYEFRILYNALVLDLYDTYATTATVTTASAVLLGRYWFNEAPSGQAVATVVDDQASPVNLTVISDTLEWRLDAGHRGLGVPVAGRTNNLQHAGIVSAPVEGTKYKTNLDGASAATFVVVAEWEGGWSDRMAGFARPDAWRILLILTDAGGGLEFRTDSENSNPRMLWPSAGWDDGVRRVFHFVYDTDHPTDSLRMRLYVDGVDQGIAASILENLPSIGDGLNWGFTDIELIALNEPDFTNGFPGTVFYMGVYDGVMTDAEITSDVAALLADDDNITYAVDVTLNGVDSLPRLPSNGTSYGYKYTVTNNSTVIEDFDLFGYPGDILATFLTVDSIVGPNVTGGATADSARITGIPASGVDSAFVWYSVANVAAGTLDSLYLNSRSLSDTGVSDPGWAFVEVVKPNLAVGKAVSPNGTQLPGTELTYTVTITNDGSEDATGVVVLDSLPEELDFKVGTVVNNLPSGVTATVEYSDNAGSTWTYTPVSAGCSAPANFDSCVTHIRWTLDNDLSWVGPDNTGNVEFVARIQ